MNVFKEEQFSSAHLGHLGLVADKINGNITVERSSKDIDFCDCFTRIIEPLFVGNC